MKGLQLRSMSTHTGPVRLTRRPILLELFHQLLQVGIEVGRLLGARDDAHHMAETPPVQVSQGHVSTPVVQQAVGQAATSHMPHMAGSNAQLLSSATACVS